MTDSASERRGENGYEPPFVESDLAKTHIPYDTGGVPFYVAIVWVGMVVTYVVWVALVLLPDLRMWIAS